MISALNLSENEDGSSVIKSRSQRRSTNAGLSKTSKVAVVSALSLVSATTSSANTYSSIRSNIIKLTPETMKCKLYCRGPKCRYCSWESWPENQMAINGLYSNWSVFIDLKEKMT